ncbi:MAG: DNA-binding ferritin-like protein [Phycisphaerales bacterium]|nr:DNA-binding ferritin-like protein [Phycisphaerales bacterium]
MKSNGKAKSPAKSARLDPTPILNQRGKLLQEYGKIVHMPIALEAKARQENVDSLNQVLADVITLRDLYKKHHWQVAGPTFYQLHLLFDKHADELTELVDSIAERVQIMGGLAIAMAADVAETTKIPRPPRGREEVPVQIDRLLEAHEIVLKEARDLVEQSDDNKDSGTNDLMASKLIPITEFQVWFVSEHVVDVPVVRAE